MRFVGKGVVRLDELMKGIGSTKVVESKIGSAKIIRRFNSSGLGSNLIRITK